MDCTSVDVPADVEGFRELFAGKYGRIHDVCCLCRGDVAIFKESKQLEGRESSLQKRCKCI